jgi:hypothetical protein
MFREFTFDASGLPASAGQSSAATTEVDDLSLQARPAGVHRSASVAPSSGQSVLSR